MGLGFTAGGPGGNAGIEDLLGGLFGQGAGAGGPQGNTRFTATSGPGGPQVNLDDLFGADLAAVRPPVRVVGSGLRVAHSAGPTCPPKST